MKKITKNNDDKTSTKRQKQTEKKLRKEVGRQNKYRRRKYKTK